MRGKTACCGKREMRVHNEVRSGYRASMALEVQGNKECMRKM